MYIYNKHKVSYKECPRYPVPRLQYTYKTGVTGELSITNILEDSNYQTGLHLLNETGTDIVLEDYDLGIEVWNWSSSHAYNRRLESVFRNLRDFKHKFLVTSFVSSDTRNKIESYFPDNPIHVIEVGFQLLPKEYLSFYQNSRSLSNRKFYSRRSLKILRNVIRPILQLLDRLSRRRIPSFHSIEDGYVYTYMNTRDFSNISLRDIPSNNDGYVYASNKYSNYNPVSNNPSSKYLEKQPTKVKLQDFKTILRYKFTRETLRRLWSTLKNNIQKNDANKLVLSYNQCPIKVSNVYSRVSSKRILNSSSKFVKQSMKQSIRIKLQGFKAILKHQLNKDTLNLLRRLWSTIQCRIDQVDQHIKYAYKHTIIRLLHRNTILHLLHRIDQVDLKSKVSSFYNKLEEVIIGGR